MKINGRNVPKILHYAGCVKPPTKIILGTVHQIFAILFIFTGKSAKNWPFSPQKIGFDRFW